MQMIQVIFGIADARSYCLLEESGDEIKASLDAIMKARLVRLLVVAVAAAAETPDACVAVLLVARLRMLVSPAQKLRMR